MKYVILGDPLIAARPRQDLVTFYGTQEHKRIATEIDLINQHEGKGLFEGVLHIDVTFYFSRQSRSKKNKKGMVYYAGRPEIFTLLKWLQNLGIGIIFSKDCSFCSFSTSKQFSDKPRTEFEIRCL